MNRLAWMCLLLIALPLAGCSDDDPTDPVEVPDPLSRLYQISALPDGNAWAVGVEGSTGRLYTRASGSWQAADEQGLLGAGGAPTGVLPVAADELYVYSSARDEVQRWADGIWAAETLSETPPGSARLAAAGDDVYLLEDEGGKILRRQAESWVVDYGVVTAPARARAVLESEAGDFFAIIEYRDEDRTALFSSISPSVGNFDHRVAALAAAGGDTVWFAGENLVRYAGGEWTTVTAMPDTQLVVAAAVPQPGEVALVCHSGLIYRWQDDTLTLVQEFPLVEPLESVAFVRDDLIYGTVNYVDPNTGHEVGIIVRYDGTQWNTDFLAPPAIP